MLNTPTEQKLQSMRLGVMADTWLGQNRETEASELSFDERFGLIVDAEHLYRENRKLTRLLHDAKLRIQGANLEDIRASAASGLSSEVLSQMRSERWITEHLNVLLSGSTGVGKTHLACALGQFACRRGYRTIYRRLPRLLEELTVARADGSYAKLLARLERAQVLIIDDWGLTPLKDSHRRDILEIIEDRHGRTSTVITSQLPLSKWHGYIGEPTIADAILDRLVHSAYKCELTGDSKRKTRKKV
jgi:DNA replication protein DnaC